MCRFVEVVSILRVLESGVKRHSLLLCCYNGKYVSLSSTKTTPLKRVDAMAFNTTFKNEYIHTILTLDDDRNRFVLTSKVVLLFLRRNITHLFG
jgi:hypothetical protein